MPKPKDKIEASVIETELRIQENAGSAGITVRLRGVLVGTAPRADESIEIGEETFKVVEVSHQFSLSPVKHVIIVTVEKPQPTAIQ